MVDEICNEGYTDEGYYLMYHTNVGYPLLDENAQLSVDAKSCEGISATYDKSSCLKFEFPSAARPEEVYRHNLNSGKGEKAVIKNGNLSLALVFDSYDFPYMLEWKSMACGDYVLGLEPVTTPMPEKNPRILKPGEKAVYTVTWRFYD